RPVVAACNRPEQRHRPNAPSLCDAAKRIAIDLDLVDGARTPCVGPSGPTSSTPGLRPVALDFFGVDQPGLAGQPRSESSGFDLVTEGRGSDTETTGGFGQGELRHPPNSTRCRLRFRKPRVGAGIDCPSVAC